MEYVGALSYLSPTSALWVGSRGENCALEGSEKGAGRGGGEGEDTPVWSSKPPQAPAADRGILASRQRGADIDLHECRMPTHGAGSVESGSGATVHKSYRQYGSFRHAFRGLNITCVEFRECSFVYMYMYQHSSNVLGIAL